MAKVLVFRYDCGWEHGVKMLPGQTVREIKSRFGRNVRKLHRRTCTDCSTLQPLPGHTEAQAD